MAEPLVTVRGLTATAGEAVLVRDIGFAVPAGRIVTLFGPSGAGKTTVAAAVAGVVPPGVAVAGEIRYGAGVRVGYLPQHAAATLNPARRIGAALGELVALHHPEARDRRARRAAIAAVLATAAFELGPGELDTLVRRFPFEFSGGERARLALAQVLAARPRLLVVDEPTVGLDTVARRALVRSLERLRAEGSSVLLVTHDPFVARVGDETVYVDAAQPERAGEGSPGPEVPGRPVPGPAVLRLAAVSVVRGRVPVLREVELAVRSGELLGVVGVSGAGKSTLARCVAGLVPARCGAVLVDGERMPALRRRDRRQIAAVQYVWQESAGSFDPRRVVLDQVADTGIRLRGLSRAAARTAAEGLLAELGLTGEQVRRHPAGLSGGQLQRAALARALLAEPRVLLCDEITTALDAPTAARILDHVDAYRRRTGAAVLVIGHDLRTQLARADRVAVVDRGRLTAIGTPDDVRATGTLAHLLAAEEQPAVPPAETPPR